MAVPASIKGINSYLKLAKEYDGRDKVISYYCRMYAVQKGISLDSKSPDCKSFLFGLMDQLDGVKTSMKDNEAIGNDIVAQAYLEETTVKLFAWADSEDRKGVFNKNVIKAFYSASLLFDVISQFGELSDEFKVQQKYAKWKATYLHKCMQTGETPVPGPEGSGMENELNVPFQSMGAGSSGIPYPSNPVAPYPPNPAPTPTQPVPAPRRVPPAAPAATAAQYVEPVSSSSVDFTQANKYCKFAMSALQYEDVDTAVDNLQKALNLLTTNR